MNRTLRCSDSLRICVRFIIDGNLVEAIPKSVDSNVLENASVERDFGIDFRDFLLLFTLRTLNPSSFAKYDPTSQHFLCVLQLQPWHSTRKSRESLKNPCLSFGPMHRIPEEGRGTTSAGGRNSFPFHLLTICEQEFQLEIFFIQRGW